MNKPKKKKYPRYKGHMFTSGPIVLDASQVPMKDLEKLKVFLIAYTKYWKGVK